MAINAAVIALALLIATGRYPNPISRAYQIFGWGKMLGAVGYALLASRPQVPELISVVIADTLCIYGSFTIYLAARHIQGKPTALAHSAIVIVACLILFGYEDFVDKSQMGLRILTSLFGIYICLIVSWELLFRFQGPGFGRAHIFAGATMLISGIALITRAFQSIHLEDATVNSVANDWAESGFFLTAIIASTVGAVNFMLISNDILNGELRLMVNMDALTGIANRRCLFERGQEEMRRARRHRHALTLLVLDIDHFKRINDTWGHGTGDQALRIVAERCRTVIRKIDCLARLGGEEFAVLLPETDAAMALDIAERMRLIIAETSFTAQESGNTASASIWLSVSIGVAVLREEADFSALLDHADQAMYLAKRDGRNRTVMHSTLAFERAAAAVSALDGNEAQISA